MTPEQYRTQQEKLLKEILSNQPTVTLEEVNQRFREKYERASRDLDPIINSLGHDLLRLTSLQRKRTTMEAFEFVKKQQRLSLEKKVRRGGMGIVAERSRELLKDWDLVYAKELAALSDSARESGSVS